MCHSKTNTETNMRHYSWFRVSHEIKVGYEEGFEPVL